MGHDVKKVVKPCPGRVMGEKALVTDLTYSRVLLKGNYDQKVEIGGFAKKESPVSLKAYSDTPEDCTVHGRGGGRETNNNSI